MNISKLAKTAVLSGALACAPISLQLVAARDTADILVDVLVAKGILTEEEAASIRQEVEVVAAIEREQVVESAVTAANETVAASIPSRDYTPIPMPKSLSGVKLYGDARFRFQGEDVDGADTRTRWRYRARFGADYDFANSPFSMGARLESALANDSTNVTYGGFWDKGDDALRLGLLYLKYETDNMSFVAGKQKSPFTLDGSFWDSDLTPEGLSETFNAGNWDFRFGQYIIDDEREDKGGGDDFLFAGQAEWANDSGFSVAPMILATTNGVSENSELGAFIGENAIRDFRDFFVVALPVEYGFELNGVKQKVFGTLGSNLKADDAVSRLGSPFYNSTDTGDQDMFFNLGYTYGSAKKAGTWEAGLNYVYIEGASISPNLSDSDFAKNSTNHKGFVLKYKYAITDFLQAGVTYMDSNLIDDDYTADVVAKEDVKLLQVDAAVKF